MMGHTKPHKIAEMFDPMFGAALVTEDGQELPITMDMVDECLDEFVEREQKDDDQGFFRNVN